MKKIDIDDELYQYIASNTQSIGESASTILRRLLNIHDENDLVVTEKPQSPTAPAKKADAASNIQSSDTTSITDTKKPVAVTPQRANVFNILNKEELAMQKGVVGRFLFILSALHRTHKADFSAVLDVQGRDRVYFATSKEALVNSGSSMNPKNITDSEYWVMTNSNTTRKKMMLHEVALGLGYSAEQAEKIRDYL
ncbi:replication initiation negative regulator SeqA [Pseudoalteromonas haloplanktis]|uniref:Negative modulator of initiation of replication n=1 Tax=Pseudoalteromonas haloplanktis TaxID=228 RepID=A0ABU1B8X1_PSEHA|nr:replication initiation negative regulator SeqA [Pseudoalteromonas haloplanktis]MDQ9090776.1 replication initiation negative regulator SeqA [Pseudoalteromonas haloplanktis]